VHIFWQKRVREADAEAQWWYPCQTSGGAIGDDRLVFPIPPGTHWRDEMPVILPKEPAATGQLPPVRDKGKRLPMDAPSPNGPAKHGPRQYGAPSAKPVAVVAPIAPVSERVVDKPKRERAPKVKCDPKHLALARELRDRWSEHVASGQLVIEGAEKYDVTRVLTNAPVVKRIPMAA
jgi:hypothetical protein